MVKYYRSHRIIIIISLVVFVYSEETLRLRDAAVVYGHPFALVCYTTVDASTQYASFYRSLSPNSDGDLVAYIRAGPGSCRPSEASLPKYNYSCDNNGKEITLTVPGDSINEHNTFWRCINPGGTVLANNNMVSIFVNVPISFVQLSPAGIVTVRELSSRILTCTTSFCRPKAVISWWKNDVMITDMANSFTYDQNTTTGTLVYTGNRLDNGHSIVCKAWNGYGNQQTSQQTILDIRYAPASPPTIGGYSNGSLFSVIENVSQSLACIVIGGNPLASLSWKCFGLAVSSITVNQTVTSTISLTVNRIWDHQQCQCVSTQEIQGNRTAFVTVNVLYPPNLIPFILPVKVIEGNPLELLCRADGNPPPKLTWSPLGDATADQSRLYYHNISRSNYGTHTCTATNTMEPSTGNPVTWSDSRELIIDVLFPPIVTPFTSVSMVEGDSLQQDCRAEGNPLPKLTWSPRGDDTVNQSRLYYRNISRTNHGNHTCTASNIMEPTIGGSVTKSDLKVIVIDVQYRASISAFTAKDNNNMLMENDSLQLHCQVDSNPYSDIFLYHEDTLQLMKQENALKLNYAKTVGCLDAGKYTCTARNKIMNGNSVSSDLQIMVACSPRFDHRKNVARFYYAGLYSSVTLEVFVIAYPEPANISWYHRENETDMWQRVTYQSPVSFGLFSSILITLTSTRDFGYYMVTMDNYLGNFSHSYNIIPESIPGVPKNLSVTDSGLDSVTLEWEPGFDGGQPQHFIIEYATHPDGAWLKSNAILDDGSPKQSFILSGLQQKTTNQLRMYAENKIGRSEKTQAIKVTTSDGDLAEVFPVGAVVGGISGAVVTVVVAILVLIVFRRGGLWNKDKGGNFTKELQADGKSIKNHVYASSGTSFIPTGGEYEALQANRNEGSLYQELSDIKSCADTNCSLRRNVTDTSEKHPTYVNTKETPIDCQDQGNLPKGENKIYENTTVQA